MKKVITIGFMSLISTTLLSCGDAQTASTNNDWIVDRFDDVKVIRYEVPGFEELPLNEKLMIYYMGEASKWGRDILFDQNFKYNLAVRRTLETIYTDYAGDRTSQEWLSFEKYLKKVWFANGIHHHYSNEKFTPQFSADYFDEIYKSIPAEKFASELVELHDTVVDAMFNPDHYTLRVNAADGVDVITESANNYYEGVNQQQVEDFYAKITDDSDERPISYGLNSKVVMKDGEVTEQVWKIGGMYSSALEKCVYWLEKASEVATYHQKQTIAKLIEFYKSGDLKDYDAFNVSWVQDTKSNVDFVNGFTENYGDPLGRKASWEAVVNFRDEEACKRTEIIAENAQWFEDHSPVQKEYKKEVVKGVSAKVITVAMLGGDCYPSTPIGINLPNADWIRKEHGSKSVTIDNITYAYDRAAQGSGFAKEFILRESDRELAEKYGKLASDLHTDLHECLGHGSGQLAPTTKANALKVYDSPLEETRADLFGLYYLGDPKMIEIGLIPSFDVAKAGYANYVMNGAMTQLSRVELGKNVEQAHMRNRKTIVEWCLEKGAKDNVIEWVKDNGKRYLVVNDFEKLRELFGEMLREVQRIKSEGDYEAAKAMIEGYGVKVDQEMHAEVLERYKSLNIEPYGGFVNPDYELVEQDGEIVDVKINYPNNYTEQMLEYSKDYSVLPTIN